MTIKVIASDMDGTFLDDKESYDKERFSQILGSFFLTIFDQVLK